MNMKNQIKNKEDSLAALMSRILKEPLEPIGKSIEVVYDQVLDASEKLENIEANISAHSGEVEKLLGRASRALNELKNEDLPDHVREIQKELKDISAANLEKIQSFLDAQQQFGESLAFLLQKNHDKLLSDIQANQELSQRAIAEITQQCTASNKTLVDGLQKIALLVENSSSTQQSLLKKNNEVLLDRFGSIVNDHRTIKQSLTHLEAQYEAHKKSLMNLSSSSSSIYARLADMEKNNKDAMDSNQLAQTHRLAEQNSALTSHILTTQAKLKTLTIMTGLVFVLILGYVGYDVWSKFI